ncbi:MAG: ABC transporter ATP-binding protein [Acidimicrobiia bacterium]|nr:ABC transporter ATP-binding protein [bacterium]MXZ30381.1 ABC transporter ATP-binding protein [Acidimicrobiia bacterium]MYJ14627.1 ABC transporter ATP-binding protein [Acidimicrobiia bacterium]
MLSVDDLSIGLVGRRGETVPVVERARLRIGEGETLGLVGESGSGKSMLCRSLVGTLYRHAAVVTGGSIRFEGTELVGASDAVWRSVRGHRIAYVPQSSLAGINPVLTVGRQLTALVRAASRDAGGDRSPRARVRELLELVEIPRIDSVMNERPHQLSGGMRQRVIIAGALARDPSLLIADEPTTALDVRVQARILDLLRRLREQLGMSLLLVSHDLAVVEEVCDAIVVLYAGAVMESGPQALVREQPRHPYTAGLVAAARMELAGGYEPIPGEAPSVGAWPAACRFSPRCGLTLRLGEGAPHSRCCEGGQPQPAEVDGRLTACLFASSLAGEGAPTVGAQTVAGETP